MPVFSKRLLAPLVSGPRAPVRALLVVFLAALIEVGVMALVPATRTAVVTQPYVLTGAAKSLLGPVDAKLSKMISYDAKNQQYVFNQTGKSAGASPAGPSPGFVAHSNTATANPYSIDLPVDPSKGITYYDNELQLSFKAVPGFALEPAQDIGGRIVYGLPGGGEVIYSVKGNGLKEDIVLDSPVASQTFTYRLALPDTLQAKTITGSGSIGIYSADRSLFGHISFGSSEDQTQVMHARVQSAKTNLVFGFPAPLIKQTGQKGTNGAGSVRYDLRGDALTVSAEGMTNLSYPISVDPSVVVNTTAGFKTGNNEDNIDFGTNKINRGAVTGGAVGAWATTSGTGLTTAAEVGGAAAYNGYIYELGGITTGGSSTSTVYLDTINSDGTLGATWTTETHALPNTINNASTVAYNGYIYEIGGNTGSTTQNVDYASLDASTGAVGAWTQITSGTGWLPAATQGADAVVYDGYIYLLGGYTGVSLVNMVYYAKVNADGSLGAWSTAANHLPPAGGIQHGSAAVYNGYVYYVGGSTGSSVNTDYYAALNSDGSVGTWNTTTVFPTVVQGNMVYAYDGYLYSAGGNNGSYEGDVYYAPIYANGTVGSWVKTNGFITISGLGQRAVYNGCLYKIGGYSPAGGQYQTDVEYAKIQPAGYLGSPNSTTPNAWAATTVLGTATYFATSVAYNGYVYEIGGFTTAVTKNVYYASIGSTGTLGSWTSTTVLPTATYYSSSVAYNGYLYEIGGYTTAATAVVDYAPLNVSTGAVGAWTATTVLPTATQKLAAAVYNGYVYALGGAVVSTVDYALLCTGSNSGTGGCGSTAGTVGTWNSTSSLIGADYGGAFAVDNGYLYEIGGNVYNSGVYYTGIAGDGTLSGWSPTTSIPTGTQSATAVADNGYLYEIGGCSSSCPTTTVEYAPIGSSGSVGSWTATTSLPTATEEATSVVYNGYVYEIGGFTTAATTTVDYALINNGGPGTLGSWTATTSLPTATNLLTAVAYNGYVYEIGGFNGTTSLATVNFAQFNSNGSLVNNLISCPAGGTLYPASPNGTWCTTTSLPTADYYATSAAYNGYLYEIGGCASSCPSAVVDYAAINANGTLGSWVATASLPTATYYATSAAYNGYLYEIGGYTTAATAVVNFAKFNSDGTLANNLTSCPGGGTLYPASPNGTWCAQPPACRRPPT